MNQLEGIKKAFKAMKKPDKRKKRGAPTKKCSICGSKSHARASKCECGYQFYIPKKELREKQAANWRELKKGDIIKVVAGSGPYFLSKDRPGERIMMGEKGKFEVEEILDKDSRCCGIYAHQLYGRAGKSHYREWIYMGESYYSEDNSIHKEPHRIKVLKSCQAT